RRAGRRRARLARRRDAGDRVEGPARALTDTLATLAIALGASWASGINPYAAILLMGGAQLSGLVTLPHDLQVLGSPWVLGVVAILFALNFCADKIPLIDSINDVLHTFVRIPAGALLAFGAADQ